jgi:hypothetical protein
MAETPHQGVVLLSASILLSELDEPFTECVVEGSLLSPGELTGLLDKVLVGA